MFTGIVQGIGRISEVAASGDGCRIAVDAEGFDISDVAVGDSVAVNGCCLTVTAIDGATLRFDVSAETLRCTSGLDMQGDVNLEKALRIADRLGGHLVQGHVDGVGTVVAYSAVAGEAGGSWSLAIDVPADVARFVATKGSVAVDGVSLTVNDVVGTRFHVNLIPHTLAVTTLRSLTPGTRVNVEADLVARYVARLREFDAD